MNKDNMDPIEERKEEATEANAFENTPSPAASAESKVFPDHIKTPTDPDATRESDSVYQRTGISEEEKDEFAPESDSKIEEKKDNYTGTTPTFITGMIKAAVYLTCVIIISVFLAVGIIIVGNDVFALVKEDREVEITITEGMTVEELVEILKEEEIISFPAIFKLYASMKDMTDEDLVPGTYTISSSMNYDILRNAFKPVFKREIVRLTIPEGSSVLDIISIFTEAGIGTYDGFVRAINDFDYSEYFDFIPEINALASPDRYFKLEGYLYPDTYDFYSDATETQIVYKLLENFDAKFSEEMKADALEAGYTLDQIMIIASLVQKEAYYYEDYDSVASVFINRLQKPATYPKLESDATVAYAIELMTGKRPDDIQAEELNIDSPYNTRKYDGLTPGPICNPGYEAIMCAIYPARTTYYYFVTDNNGYNVFSRTFEEHKKAIARIEAEKENADG